MSRFVHSTLSPWIDRTEILWSLSRVTSAIVPSEDGLARAGIRLPELDLLLLGQLPARDRQHRNGAFAAVRDEGEGARLVDRDAGGALADRHRLHDLRRRRLEVDHA